MTITIRPCPFCDHDDVELDEVDRECFAVVCPECECIGPISRENIEAAIELWNRSHDAALRGRASAACEGPLKGTVMRQGDDEC